MMRLSEAILLGAMMKPQGFGGFNKSGVSCGLEAGLDAVGLMSRPRGNYHAAVQIWPWLRANIECPWCMENQVIYDVIGLCLNDRGKWSRQKIAKWVATVEPVDVHETEPSQVQHVQEASR
jgi:hypothetical protein